MAVTVLEHVSQDEMNWYHETRYWMHVSDMKTAEQHAIETGIEKGIRQGIEQGILSANFENAKKMLECNIDLETIYKVTGISKEELEL